MTELDIYRGQDPASAAMFSITQAAEYLNIPRGTVAAWVKGREYQTTTGKREWCALIQPQDPGPPPMLSFVNMVELQVLRALRTVHGITMPVVREAIGELERRFGSPHPLATHRLAEEHGELFVEHVGKRLHLAGRGQISLFKSFVRHVERIEFRYESALRIFPFAQRQDLSSRHLWSIDPKVQFGRLCIAGTRVTVESIKNRHTLG